MSWAVHETKEVAYTGVMLPKQATDGAEITRNDKVVVVRHDQKSYELLKSRGMLLPPPVKRYGYPGRFKPMQHQKETVEFLVNNPRSCCTDPIGSGKTNSALWAMDYLVSQGCVKRTLIVAPVSVRESVWMNEIFLALPKYRAALVTGPRKRKQTIVADGNLDIVITNPDSLHIIKEHTKDIDLIIMDEATDAKTVTTRRWKALRDIAKGKRLWLMTGTPTPQAPTDAYGLYKLITPEPKPIGFLYFKDITMKKVSQFRWEPREDANETVAKLLQPAIRHTPEQCTELPEKRIVEREVPLTSEQKTLITRFKQEAQAEINGEKISAFNAAAVLTKTLQVMAGGVYNADKETREVDASPLFEAVEGIIKEADAPVLVFVSFRSSVDAITRNLRKAGHRVAEVHGGTKHSDRTTAFTTFQAGGLDAIVAVASAMSHGVTLTRGRVVVWVTPPAASIYEQANGRVHRKGQKNNVIIYNMTQNTLAARLYSRLQLKIQDQETLLSLLKQELL